MTETTPTPSDVERELGELRARAYGPESDIQDDPVALARLVELEAARADAIRAAAEVDEPVMADAAADETARDAVDEPSPLPEPESPTSPGDDAGASRRHRLTASRSGRFWLAAGAGLAVVAVVYGATRLLGPHPEATLWPTAGRADEEILTLIFEDVGGIDLSTLENFDSFRGLEPWSAMDFDGNPCLMIIDRSTGTVVGAECTPQEADLLVDIGTWPVMDYRFAEDLPDGSVIRFHQRGNAVDAFVHPAPAQE